MIAIDAAASTLSEWSLSLKSFTGTLVVLALRLAGIAITVLTAIAFAKCKSKSKSRCSSLKNGFKGI